MRGPKPKPIEIKLAEGAHLKNPKRFKNEPPATSSTEPVMPDDLSAAARQEWGRQETLMRAAGMWSATYQVTIELYCETYASYLNAREQVRKSGIAIMQRDKNGNVQVKRNPFSVELHKYKEETLKLLTELGMTPSSRNRVGMDTRPKTTTTTLIDLLA